MESPPRLNQRTKWNCYICKVETSNSERCPLCGAAKPWICLNNCGELNPPEAHNCSKCGIHTRGMPSYDKELGIVGLSNSPLFLPHNEQKRAVELCKELKMCTRNIAGEQLYTQPKFKCLSCHHNGLLVCKNCKSSCHANHSSQQLGSSLPFACICRAKNCQAACLKLAGSYSYENDYSKAAYPLLLYLLPSPGSRAVTGIARSLHGVSKVSGELDPGSRLSLSLSFSAQSIPSLRIESTPNALAFSGTFSQPGKPPATLILHRRTLPRLQLRLSADRIPAFGQQGATRRPTLRVRRQTNDGNSFSRLHTTPSSNGRNFAFSFSTFSSVPSAGGDADSLNARPNLLSAIFNDFGNFGPLESFAASAESASSRPSAPPVRLPSERPEAARRAGEGAENTVAPLAESRLEEDARKGSVLRRLLKTFFLLPTEGLTERMAEEVGVLRIAEFLATAICGLSAEEAVDRFAFVAAVTDLCEEIARFVVLKPAFYLETIDRYCLWDLMKIFRKECKLNVARLEDNSAKAKGSKDFLKEYYLHFFIDAIDRAEHLLVAPQTAVSQQPLQSPSFIANSLATLATSLAQPPSANSPKSLPIKSLLRQWRNSALSAGDFDAVYRNCTAESTFDFADRLPGHFFEDTPIVSTAISPFSEPQFSDAFRSLPCALFARVDRENPGRARLMLAAPPRCDLGCAVFFFDALLLSDGAVRLAPMAIRGGRLRFSFEIFAFFGGQLPTAKDSSAEEIAAALCAFLRLSQPQKSPKRPKLAGKDLEQRLATERVAAARRLALRKGVADVLSEPPAAFGDAVSAHFAASQTWLKGQMARWADEDESLRALVAEVCFCLRRAKVIEF